MKYEMVAGLETHVELSTNSKIFCGCTTRFGGEPNTNCCPICIGLPGTLPVLNREVVRYAVMAGLVMNCTINPVSKMDRKNYVYPDLSKAYQISQFDKPLCEHGQVRLNTGTVIGITRIHMEEDAGKLVHSHGDTFVDYNRGGVPLIEIVTEPDFRCIEDIRDYLEKLQRMMQYIGVSDCRMQEGSLRCDVNISVRPQGESRLGTRAEIKNMNSFAFIEKAVAYECARQIDLLESGEKVVQETRRYNDTLDCTESMRGKEDANDYRYFREPDLVTILTTAQEVEDIRRHLPELPDSRFMRYVEEWGIPPLDAQQLVKYRKIAEFFEAACAAATPKIVCNFILGTVFRRLVTETDKEACALAITPAQLGELVSWVDSGKLKTGLAKTTLDTMLDTGKSVGELLSDADIAGIDEGELRTICAQVLTDNPGAVKDFLGGKEKAFKALLGGVMRVTKGAADAAAVEQMLHALIETSPLS